MKKLDDILTFTLGITSVIALVLYLFDDNIRTLIIGFGTGILFHLRLIIYLLDNVKP